MSSDQIRKVTLELDVKPDPRLARTMQEVAKTTKTTGKEAKDALEEQRRKQKELNDEVEKYIKKRQDALTADQKARQLGAELARRGIVPTATLAPPVEKESKGWRQNLLGLGIGAAAVTGGSMLASGGLNFASTLMQDLKNPTKSFGDALLNAAEQLPFGVGSFVGASRKFFDVVSGEAERMQFEAKRRETIIKAQQAEAAGNRAQIGLDINVDAINRDEATRNRELTRQRQESADQQHIASTTARRMGGFHAQQAAFRERGGAFGLLGAPGLADRARKEFQLGAETDLRANDSLRLEEEEAYFRRQRDDAKARREQARKTFEGGQLIGGEAVSVEEAMRRRDKLRELGFGVKDAERARLRAKGIPEDRIDRYEAANIAKQRPEIEATQATQREKAHLDLQRAMAEEKAAEGELLKLAERRRDLDKAQIDLKNRGLELQRETLKDQLAGLKAMEEKTKSIAEQERERHKQSAEKFGMLGGGEQITAAMIAEKVRAGGIDAASMEEIELLKKAGGEGLIAKKAQEGSERIGANKDFFRATGDAGKLAEAEETERLVKDARVQVEEKIQVQVTTDAQAVADMTAEAMGAFVNKLRVLITQGAERQIAEAQQGAQFQAAQQRQGG